MNSAGNRLFQKKRKILHPNTSVCRWLESFCEIKYCKKVDFLLFLDPFLLELAHLIIFYADILTIKVFFSGLFSRVVKQRVKNMRINFSSQLL